MPLHRSRTYVRPQADGRRAYPVLVINKRDFVTDATQEIPNSAAQMDEAFSSGNARGGVYRGDGQVREMDEV